MAKQPESRIAVGSRVQTTERLHRMFDPPMRTPWRGEVTAPHATIAGSWHVRVDGVPALQLIHEKFLEVIG